jgi:hypothetical protein
MMVSRLAAAVFAGGIAVAPAVADEHTTFHYLEVASPAFPECRTGMVLSLPASWQIQDGAVVLLSPGPARDAARDGLVHALLSEHAAVLELAPMPCDGRHAGRDSVIAGAVGALESMTRTAGAGMVVVIGYGTGGRAVLDLVREPVGNPLVAGRPRYAAAIAMGDGEAAFALGARMPAWEQASSRLGALCHTLAALGSGTSLAADRADSAAATGRCLAAFAEAGPTGAVVGPANAAR